MYFRFTLKNTSNFSSLYSILTTPNIKLMLRGNIHHILDNFTNNTSILAIYFITKK